MKKLAQEMVARAQAAPDSIAVIDEFGSHTLRTIVDAARALADRIAVIDEAPPTALIQADNTWHTLATALAVGMRGGLVAVFSPHATESEFELAIEDIAPDIIIGDPAALAHWGVDTERFPVSGQAFETRLLRSGPKRSGTGGFGDINRWNGGTAIAMTSGSTGRPKCVVQSEDAIRYACRCTIDTVGLQPGDAIGAFVPLSSVAAFCFGMYLPAYLGGSLVAIGQWSPAAAVDAMAKHAVAWTMLVPTMALQLSVTEGSDGRLSNVRALTVGGGPMNERALENAETTLGTTFLRAVSYTHLTLPTICSV